MLYTFSVSYFCLIIIGEKQDLSEASLTTEIPVLLETIQAGLLAAAKAGRDEKLVVAMNWKDFIVGLEADCMVLTPFCDDGEWEEKVKVSTSSRSIACFLPC